MPYRGSDPPSDVVPHSSYLETLKEKKGSFNHAYASSNKSTGAFSSIANPLTSDA